MAGKYRKLTSELTGGIIHGLVPGTGIVQASVKPDGSYLVVNVVGGTPSERKQGDGRVTCLAMLNNGTGMVNVDWHWVGTSADLRVDVRAAIKGDVSFTAPKRQVSVMGHMHLIVDAYVRGNVEVELVGADSGGNPDVQKMIAILARQENPVRVVLERGVIDQDFTFALIGTKLSSYTLGHDRLKVEARNDDGVHVFEISRR